jgi:hypothetical protein
MSLMGDFAKHHVKSILKSCESQKSTDAAIALENNEDDEDGDIIMVIKGEI